MYTLWGYCKQRYAANDLKSQTQSLPPETRQSLTQKIVETLNATPNNNGEENNDVEDGGASSDNVEDMLTKLEVELEQGNQQLQHLEDKEQFLAVRIRKYQELLKEQDDHLQKIKITKTTTATTSDHQQQQYQEKVDKQQKNKEALGKVLDVHLTIMKKIKDCRRTIATLEQKKHELTNITKQCRQFLVLAEEAEREQQMGIVNEDEDENDHNGLQLVEHAPTTKSTTDVVEDDEPLQASDRKSALSLDETKNDACTSSGADTQGQHEGSPTAPEDTEIDLESGTEVKDILVDTHASVPREDIPQVEPEELTGEK
jgi:chromosome segregation ATPase